MSKPSVGHRPQHSGAADRRFAAAIIGGGVAGLCAALALRQRGLSAFVLDPRPVEATRIGMETLDPRVALLLAEIGADGVLPDAGTCTCPGTLVAWGDSRVFSREAILNPYGSGLHVERRALRMALARRAAEAGVELLLGHSLGRCAQMGWGEWEIATYGEVLTAPLAIVATGRRPFGTVPGMRQRAVDRLVAVIAEAESPAGDAAPVLAIESGPDGWWNVAPRIGGQRQVAFLTDGDLWRRMPHGVDERLEVRLRMTGLVRTLLGRRSGKPLQVVPANTAVCLPAAGERWLAIGDAALACDPLSGLGVLYAVTSGLAAAEIAAAPAEQQPSLLAAYARDHARRWADYSQARSYHYRSEKRWGDCPFWRRRARVD